ncbi:hypothetical protein [Tropicimonas sediminicola]|uniref:Uncharacterized protein n=1 Tax=Tropicimonas sediminicola TaxID=1031541 RepID=A0A239JCI7_9RHOB|nr:hypothetical protein [Tropicimonas sediminicola]SNT03756.1 hypothetical protein SAMN05421757_105217 [Tropicimonas sediminicola]
MALISDVLLIAGALGAAFYCYILSRRLNRFTNLEKGVGGAVAVLSVQVDEMTKALEGARAMSQNSADSLEALTKRAETAAGRIELILASLHDLPEPAPPCADPLQERRVRRTRRPVVAEDRL